MINSKPPTRLLTIIPPPLKKFHKKQALYFNLNLSGRMYL